MPSEDPLPKLIVVLAKQNAALRLMVLGLIDLLDQRGVVSKDEALDHIMAYVDDRREQDAIELMQREFREAIGIPDEADEQPRQQSPDAPR